MSDFESIGDRLREAIKKAGLTQKEVSDKGVISKSHLQYVLNDERDITVRKLLTLSHLIGIDLYWLITGRTAEDVVKRDSTNKVKDEISEYLVNNQDIPRVVNGYNKLTNKQKELVRDLIDELTLLNDQINDGFLTKGD